MSDVIIRPGRDKGEPRLSDTGLLLINPGEATRAVSLAKEYQGIRHYLFNSNLYQIPAIDRRRPFFVAGPAVGAPMAVLTLEKLIALDARRIIIYGWCGALNDVLRTGDVLLPTWAVSDEGTSSHYPVNTRPESHETARDMLAQGLTAMDLKVLSGPVWTTDAPYREDRTRVKQLGGEGVLGVDMEFAALAAVAAFRKIEVTAVLLVSDELWSGTWKPGFHTKSFKKKSREILNYLMDFCSTINKS